MLAIVKSLGFADIKSFSAALKTTPKEHPTSADALIDTYKGYIAGMKPKLPELFGRLPKAPLEVVQMPAFIEKDQAAAFYDNGTPDGSRPGRVDVNTYNFAERSLAPVEAVSYHEGIPGHHLQISIAQELTGLGIAGVPTQNPGFSQMAITGYPSLGVTNVPNSDGSQNRQITGDLTWTKGEHTIKFGVQAYWLQTNFLSSQRSSGIFT